MGVSYLVSLYNKSAYIEAVIAAIVAELEVTGGELLVYDDASTDDSVARLLASPYASRVTLIRAAVNGGCVVAASALILAASQEWVRFVVADDLIVAGSTAAMRTAMQHSDLGFLYGRVVPQGDWQPTPCEVPLQIAPQRQALRGILRNTEFNPSAMMLRTALLKRVAPLPAGFRHAQDFIIGVRLARLGVAIGACDAVVALSPASQEGRLSRRMAEMFGEMARFVAEEGRDPRFPVAALRYAAGRFAARCLRYHAREAVGRLAPGARFWLRAIGYSAPVLPQRACVRALLRVAAMFQRESGVSVQRAAGS